jgi:hypothetical protein
MFNYLINCISDLFLGYVDIECSNKKCNQLLKISRNHKSIISGAELVCSMGCAFEIYNEESKNPITNHIKDAI